MATISGGGEQHYILPTEMAVSGEAERLREKEKTGTLNQHEAKLLTEHDKQSNSVLSSGVRSTVKVMRNNEQALNQLQSQKIADPKLETAWGKFKTFVSYQISYMKTYASSASFQVNRTYLKCMKKLFPDKEFKPIFSMNLAHVNRLNESLKPQTQISLTSDVEQKKPAVALKTDAYQSQAEDLNLYEGMPTWSMNLNRDGSSVRNRQLDAMSESASDKHKLAEQKCIFKEACEGVKSFCEENANDLNKAENKDVLEHLDKNNDEVMKIKKVQTQCLDDMYELDTNGKTNLDQLNALNKLKDSLDLSEDSAKAFAHSQGYPEGKLTTFKTMKFYTDLEAKITELKGKNPNDPATVSEAEMKRFVAAGMQNATRCQVIDRNLLLYMNGMQAKKEFYSKNPEALERAAAKCFDTSKLDDLANQNKSFADVVSIAMGSQVKSFPRICNMFYEQTGFRAEEFFKDSSQWELDAGEQPWTIQNYDYEKQKAVSDSYVVKTEVDADGKVAAPIDQEKMRESVKEDRKLQGTIVLDDKVCKTPEGMAKAEINKLSPDDQKDPAKIAQAKVAADAQAAKVRTCITKSMGKYAQNWGDQMNQFGVHRGDFNALSMIGMNPAAINSADRPAAANRAFKNGAEALLSGLTGGISRTIKTGGPAEAKHSVPLSHTEIDESDPGLVKTRTTTSTATTTTTTTPTTTMHGGPGRLWYFAHTKKGEVDGHVDNHQEILLAKLDREGNLKKLKEDKKLPQEFPMNPKEEGWHKTENQAFRDYLYLENTKNEPQNLQAQIDSADTKINAKKDEIAELEHQINELRGGPQFLPNSLRDICTNKKGDLQALKDQLAPLKQEVKVMEEGQKELKLQKEGLEKTRAFIEHRYKETTGTEATSKTTVEIKTETKTTEKPLPAPAAAPAKAVDAGAKPRLSGLEKPAPAPAPAPPLPPVEPITVGHARNLMVLIPDITDEGKLNQVQELFPINPKFVSAEKVEQNKKMRENINARIENLAIQYKGKDKIPKDALVNEFKNEIQYAIDLCKNFHTDGLAKAESSSNKEAGVDHQERLGKLGEYNAKLNKLTSKSPPASPKVSSPATKAPTAKTTTTPPSTPSPPPATAKGTTAPVTSSAPPSAPGPSLTRAAATPPTKSPKADVTAKPSAAPKPSEALTSKAPKQPLQAAKSPPTPATAAAPNAQQAASASPPPPPTESTYAPDWSPETPPPPEEFRTTTAATPPTAAPTGLPNTDETLEPPPPPPPVEGAATTAKPPTPAKAASTSPLPPPPDNAQAPGWTPETPPPPPPELSTTATAPTADEAVTASPLATSTPAPTGLPNDNTDETLEAPLTPPPPPPPPPLPVEGAPTIAKSPTPARAASKTPSPSRAELLKDIQQAKLKPTQAKTETDDKPKTTLHKAFENVIKSNPATVTAGSSKADSADDEWNDPTPVAATPAETAPTPLKETPKTAPKTADEEGLKKLEEARVKAQQELAEGNKAIQERFRQAQQLKEDDDEDWD